MYRQPDTQHQPFRWCTAIIVFALTAAIAGSVSTAVAAEQIADVPDNRITEAVDDAMFVARGVSPRLIDIATRDGVVTLSGTVDSLLAKERATRVASRIKGVRAVVNQLRIQPSDRSDAQIRADVIAALASDPATDSWEVQVKSIDGHITIDGTVDSWQEKWLSKRIAMGVKGVRGITSNIDVSYKTERPDDEIATEVRQRLMWDSRINDALMTIAVTDGNVMLSGSVGSAYEKTLARQLAWTTGVDNVNAEHLEVKYWLRDDMRRYDRFVDVSDEQIKNAVNDALLHDPRVYAFKPTVQVSGGVVTLRGEVDSLKAKRAAAQDASNTVGVWHVVNRLKVRPDDMPTETMIWNDVSNALQRDPLLDRYELFVDVTDGVVTIKGEVDSFYEKWQAAELASRVLGVTEVRNFVHVDYEEPRYDPFTVYDWDPIEFDLDFDREVNMPDTAIRDEIDDEMFWSPFVDSDDVKVTVDDGVATLRGTVDSWYEFHSATENAYEGGATLVINKLDVEFGPDGEQAGE